MALVGAALKELNLGEVILGQGTLGEGTLGEMTLGEVIPGEVSLREVTPRVPQREVIPGEVASATIATGRGSSNECSLSQVVGETTRAPGPDGFGNGYTGVPREEGPRAQPRPLLDRHADPDFRRRPDLAQ